MMEKKNQPLTMHQVAAAQATTCRNNLLLKLLPLLPLYMAKYWWDLLAYPIKFWKFIIVPYLVIIFFSNKFVNLYDYKIKMM
jgi:hypothetical protein